jgi:4-hydroxy-3-polyprenylbenzoate decarboxylase
MITDLRSALSHLAEHGELVTTDVPVNPDAELAGVYKLVGSGGTVRRPTRKGPAMVFNAIDGHPGKSVAIGLMATRKRVGLLLGVEPEQLGWALRESVNNPVEPVEVNEAPCQEVVHRADEPGFDILRHIPVPTTTPADAGPYLTLGMCYATHPVTGVNDVTIHRLCVQGPAELSIFFTPGVRHIGAMAAAAEKLDVELPISISIGVDPAIEIASCFEPPTTPLGFDELTIAGAMRGAPVELVPCLTIPQRAIANAEYVIEGVVVPGVRVQEDQNSQTGIAMPEFPGYDGVAAPDCWKIKIKAVTHRRNPILQTCIGPSEEHVSMAGIPTEASILDMCEKAMPGRVRNVYAHSSGGGKYLAVIQFRKNRESDEGRQRQAALVAFSAFSELKHIILVDEEV